MIFFILLSVLGVTSFSAWCRYSYYVENNDRIKMIRGASLTRFGNVLFLISMILVTGAMVFAAVVPTMEQTPIVDEYNIIQIQQDDNNPETIIFIVDKDGSPYPILVSKDELLQSPDVEHKGKDPTRLIIATYPYVKAKTIFIYPAKERIEYHLLAG